MMRAGGNNWNLHAQTDGRLSSPKFLTNYRMCGQIGIDAVVTFLMDYYHYC